MVRLALFQQLPASADPQTVSLRCSIRCCFYQGQVAYALLRRTYWASQDSPCPQNAAAQPIVTQVREGLMMEMERELDVNQMHLHFFA